MKNSLKIFAILILTAVFIAFTESVTITGQVRDEKGNPIPGVMISVKGTADGTVTDINGNYKITVDVQNRVLVFSYIGYLTVNEKINNRTVINIRMKPDLSNLDEIVVVGYGVKKEAAAIVYDMVGSAPSTGAYNCL